MAQVFDAPPESVTAGTLLNCPADWAAEYARRGFALVEIPPGGKFPTGDHWPDRAVTDPEVARQRWQQHPRNGMGVVLGRSTPPLVSLDVDSVEHTAATFEALGLNLEAIKDKALVVVGNPARFRLLFRAPAGVTLGKKVLQWPKPSPNQKAVTVFELRAGDSQDVLPPTIHPDTGKPYRWLRGPWEFEELPTLPPALRELWESWDSYRGELEGLCPWGQPWSPAAPPRQARGGNLNIIGAFNEAHDVRAILERHGYSRKGKRYVAPDSSTGMAGVVVLESGRVYSHHGADPLAIGKALDAFDLFKILEHGGDQRAAIKAAAGLLGIELKKPDRQQPPRPGPAPAMEAPPADPADPWPVLTDDDRPQFKTTDLSNAYRLASIQGRHLLFVEGIGWHTWAGTHWRKDEKGAVRKAKNLGRLIAREGAEVSRQAADCDDPDRRKSLQEMAEHLAGWARKSESRDKIKAALDLAGAYLKVDLDEMDCDPWALVCTNGTVDLRTGKLRGHHRTDFSSRALAVAYDPAAICPTWLSFLDRIFAGNRDLIDFVQKALGYALTGDTREQCLFVLHGCGANGKSTLMGAFQALMGDYARQAAPDLLLAKHGDRHPTELAELRAARAVVAMETGEGRRLDENLVKQMTGGDKMKGRYMRQDFFEFQPTHKLFMATNHRPTIRGTDHAIWRRIRLIPFEVTIPPEERDGTLPDRLVAELPGILAWCVRGCIAWQREGLKPPPEVMAATEGYRAEMDVLAAFLGECCVIHRNKEATAKDLYRAYGQWCEENGERAENQRAFGMRLTERGFERKRSTGGMHKWIGLGVLSDRSDRSDAKSGINGFYDSHIEANRENGSLGSLGSLDDDADWVEPCLSPPPGELRPREDGTP